MNVVLNAQTKKKPKVIIKTNRTPKHKEDEDIVKFIDDSKQPDSIPEVRATAEASPNKSKTVSI
jgi:hypothetical protein